MGPGDVSRETSPRDDSSRWQDQVKQALPPVAPPTAWKRYLTREHQARDQYLAVVEAAHREYLIGAWPDRDSYQVVERQAWATYFAAGRDAWRTYRTETGNPPPRPPTSFWGEKLGTAQQQYTSGIQQPAAAPSTAAILEANEHAARVGWPIPYPQFTPHPETGGLNEFDQRQETYLAADPERRDTP